MVTLQDGFCTSKFEFPEVEEGFAVTMIQISYVYYDCVMILCIYLITKSFVVSLSFLP